MSRTYDQPIFVVLSPATCVRGPISAEEIQFQDDAVLVFENENPAEELRIDCEKMTLAGDTNSIASRSYLMRDGVHGNPGATGASFAGSGGKTGRPGGSGAPGRDGENGKVSHSISLRIS